MILLFCDETSVEPNQGPFFIYGGLAVPGGTALTLSAAFQDLLSEYGYDPMKDPADPRPLKFNCKPPEGIDHETIKTIKRKALALAAEAGCKLYVNLILHDIVRKIEKRHWPLNQLLWCFDASLEKELEDALVVIDQYEKIGGGRSLQSIMQERFLRGLSFPGGRYRLRRILGIAQGCIGSSHFSSIVDVALGCFRLAVNKRDDEEQRRLGRTLLEQIAPLFPKDEQGRVPVPHLSFMPGAVYRPLLRHYQEVAEFLVECGLPPGLLPGMKG